jgi:hypothetical protein
MLPCARARAVRTFELRKLELAPCHGELPRCAVQRAAPISFRHETSDAIQLLIELNLARARQAQRNCREQWIPRQFHGAPGELAAGCSVLTEASGAGELLVLRGTGSMR